MYNKCKYVLEKRSNWFFFLYQKYNSKSNYTFVYIYYVITFLYNVWCNVFHIIKKLQ